MGNFLQDANYANRTGKCPVCRKRKRGHWKDTGALRMTCGHPACVHRWLPGGRSHRDDFEREQPVLLDEGEQHD